MSDLIEQRVTRLEQDMAEIRSAVSRMEPLLSRIDEQIAHLVTRSDLSERPSEIYFWTILGTLTAAFIAAFALGVSLR